MYIEHRVSSILNANILISNYCFFVNKLAHGGFALDSIRF